MYSSRFPALLAVLLASGAMTPALAAERISPDDFAKLEKLIKPQPGESLWMEIPWRLNLWEARQEAAAQGKPIFLWSGGGAPPIGGC